MTYALAHSCFTCHGMGSEALMNHLYQGSRPLYQKHPYEQAPIFKAPWKNTSSYADSLASALFDCWQDMVSHLPPHYLQTEVQSLGVILASTKGRVEDIVWQQNQFPQESLQDPISPLLQNFLGQLPIKPSICTGVSNACASSHAALYLAQEWLNLGLCDHVLILAGDRVGPFVYKGFYSLQALSSSGCRPFASDRNGLTLGDGVATLLVTHQTSPTCRARLGPVGLDAEGFAVTRPHDSGASLKRALETALRHKETPDLIIAHGTATQTNDRIENHVFSELFQQAPTQPRITATKWSIGHTLGASGLMDMIVALEILERQKVFPISSCQEVDPQFQCPVLHLDANLQWYKDYDRVLVSSLGFGGLHAGVLVQRLSSIEEGL